ncbi:MAG: quinolinate synthase NadA [Chloroflexia bacterium]|nr:quinolinate synthase NadA [Chloroflexia bacterium]
MDHKNELVERILALKAERDAIILAHNYQIPEIQDLADITGDSLQLARQASSIDRAVIVFCGVDFMAESAALLNPDKTVLIPSLQACCPMAAMATAEQVRDKRREYPRAAVCSYVNTSAAVKAVSDICCTSSNGVAVVRSLSEQQVLFVPDKNLGHYVSTQTDQEVILWPGYCYVHERLSLAEVKAARREYPQAVLMVHPECRPEVVAEAEVVLSTAGMLRYAAESDADSFIVGTEAGLLHPLRRENPDKHFYLAAPHMICGAMKQVTLDNLLAALQHNQHVVTVPKDVAVAARRALERMLEVT